jgi:flagellar biosynthesis GTPase FlhF
LPERPTKRRARRHERVCLNGLTVAHLTPTLTVAHLTPTLAYRLAAKSAAPDIVNEVLERAGKGEIIDQREVADKLLNARNQKKYEAEKKAKRDSRSAKAISRREAEEERREEEARQLREREKKAASTIIARLGTESVQFLLEQLGDRSWSVIALLREETSRMIRAKAQETQSPSPAPPSVATASRADMPDIPALFDRRLQQAKAGTA